MIDIEVQHFSGCPNSKKMLDNVKRAIEELDLKFEFKEILIENLEEARKNNFRGSPTLIINGIDIENMPVPELPSLACRYYANGIPTVEDIKARIFKETK